MKQTEFLNLLLVANIHKIIFRLCIYNMYIYSDPFVFFLLRSCTPDFSLLQIALGYADYLESLLQ